MVVVALGSPNVPVTTCAEALPPAKKLETASNPKVSFRIPAPKSILVSPHKNAGLASATGGLRWVDPATNERKIICIRLNEVRPHPAVLQVPQSLAQQPSSNQPGNGLPMAVPISRTRRS